MKNEPAKIRTLVTVWAVLVTLHFTILGLSFFRLGGFGTPVIICLAFVQMLLVMLYFMELRHADKLVRIFAAAGFFWLLFQLTLVGADYFTRAFH